MPKSTEAVSPERQLVHLVFDAKLLKRVEDFRFRNRFATRAAAIKWLLTWALDQKPKAE